MSGEQTKIQMAKLTNSPLLQCIRGKIGDFYFRTIRGNSYIACCPKTTGRRTALQTAQQNRFREATKYAKSKMNDPKMKQLYETGLTDKKHNAYLVAVSDYLNAPTVIEIDTTYYHGRVGDVIPINASDDFDVTRVQVMIKDKEGREIESGEATRDLAYRFHWKYGCRSKNRALAGTTVSATAFDLPGNQGSLEKVVEHSQGKPFVCPTPKVRSRRPLKKSRNHEVIE